LIQIKNERVTERWLAGLINPLTNQRKIIVGLSCLGSGMTTMIVIVFSIALALLLAYFIK